jgi:hypothetical protein
MSLIIRESRFALLLEDEGKFASFAKALFSDSGWSTAFAVTCFDVVGRRGIASSVSLADRLEEGKYPAGSAAVRRETLVI